MRVLLTVGYQGGLWEDGLSLGIDCLDAFAAHAIPQHTPETSALQGNVGDAATESAAWRLESLETTKDIKCLFVQIINT